MSRLNILLIVVDSLRADHLGCYGYAKNTSPNLDGLAREGTLFRQKFAPGIPTTPAFTTLFSGLHPYRHGVLSHGGDALLEPGVLLLPQLAKSAGATTIAVDNLAVQGNGRGSWFTRGFDFYSAFSYQPFGRQSDELADRTMRFLTEFARDNFFLFLHLWDPHTPYAPPAPFDAMHYQAGSTPDGHLQKIKSLAPEYYNAFLSDMRFEKPEDFDWIMAQYDGEISYADQQIGRIIEHVKDLNLWDETAIVVMSDHGECFGEGGFWFDHHGLFDANLRVASIWRVPGMEARDCNDFVSTEDVLPTLCELCDWPLPDYEISGQSFAPALRGYQDGSHLSGVTVSSGNPNPIRGRELFIGVECSRQASLCVRTEKWKLIVPIGKNARGENVPDFYGDARAENILLFDLENDPHETRDVSREYSQTRDELLTKLNQWRETEKHNNGGRDLILETPLGLPFDEFMKRIGARKSKA